MFVGDFAWIYLDACYMTKKILKKCHQVSTGYWVTKWSLLTIWRFKKRLKFMEFKTTHPVLLFLELYSSSPIHHHPTAESCGMNNYRKLYKIAKSNPLLNNEQYTANKLTFILWNHINIHASLYFLSKCPKRKSNLCYTTLLQGCQSKVFLHSCCINSNAKSLCYVSSDWSVNTSVTQFPLIIT